MLYSGNADGIALKKATEDIVDRSFLPALQQLLDRYSPEHEVLSVENIVCDIKVDDDSINDRLTEKIIQQLEKQLIEKLFPLRQSENAPAIEVRFAETLLFYLENGYLPWFANIKSKQELNDAVTYLAANRAAPGSRWKYLQLLKQEDVILRICNDFENMAFWSFLDFLLGFDHTITIEDWKSDLSVLLTIKTLNVRGQSVTYFYKKALLRSIAHYNAGETGDVPKEVNKRLVWLFTDEIEKDFGSFDKLLQAEAVEIAGKLRNPVLRDRISQRNIPADKPLALKKATDREEAAESMPKEKTLSADDPMYINNSGLVIIAPYFGMFFNKLALIGDNEITDVPKAVTLLNYIATGNDTFAEFEILLPKLLCGLDPGLAIPSSYEVTREDAELVNELLNSIIANWSILKNTSIDGLRGTFLLREGKLTFNNSGYHLKVQQSSVDILIEHLPWSISMIRLPWMKNLLTVDWV